MPASTASKHSSYKEARPGTDKLDRVETYCAYHAKSNGINTDREPGLLSRCHSYVEAALLE